MQEKVQEKIRKGINRETEEEGNGKKLIMKQRIMMNQKLWKRIASKIYGKKLF